MTIGSIRKFSGKLIERISNKNIDEFIFVSRKNENSIYFELLKKSDDI